MFFNRKKEKLLIMELQKQLEIVEKGFFIDSHSFDRIAAASALGSIKGILRLMSEKHTKSVSEV